MAVEANGQEPWQVARARLLQAVKDNQSIPTEPEPQRYLLSADADVNVRWLVAELGRGGLSGYFRRGDNLVLCHRIGEDGYIAPRGEGDTNGPATLRTAGADDVLGTLALDYRIRRRRGRGEDQYEVGAIFPTQAAKLTVTQLHRAEHLRPLLGVTHTPVVRADGTILSAPGYDDASGFLLLPQVSVPPVPTQPTREQLVAAVTLLRRMVAEFVWAGDHDEVNFLGLLLTPLLRQLCPPPYKLAALMAHQPGSGKSLLASILRDVHGGVLRTEMPHDDAELGKSLTSILSITTAPVVEFDNVSGTLRSSRLAGLLTSDTYTDRVLGSTSHVDMTNDRLWVITGNNLNLGGDLVRRTLWVTIDPKVPNPELRTGFELDLEGGWVREHRGELLHALLTLVAAWQAAGRPTPAQRSSDSYGRWRAVVTGILAHAGVPGEFDAAESAQQTVGVDDEEWAEFLAALHREFAGRSFTTAEVVAALVRSPSVSWEGGPAPLLDVLPSELSDRWNAAQRSGQCGPFGKSLGRWLQNRDRRWAGGYSAERLERKSATNSALFRIVRHSDSGGDRK